VLELVALLEKALGRSAIVTSVPRPPMDVEETFADVEAIGKLTGFQPSTSLAEGIPRFAAWFRGWNGTG
jgi:UDP-glucuronate 4-epimerase